MKLRRAVLKATVTLAALALVACASPPQLPQDAQTRQWTGRVALQVASEPPQSFYAGFELRGDAQTGQLALTSPLGNTLATLTWAPGSALMHSLGTERRYDSVEAMALAITGAPLPLRALFSWLDGTPGSADGWQADLSRLAEGRLLARRLEPAPTTELRLILDR